MEKSRRSFIQKGLAGAMLIATPGLVKANVADMAKPGVAKAANPFHLGMAGFTFVKFDLETTLKTLQRLDIGHDLRNGRDPVADLKKYHTRVFDMHIKDVTDSTKAGHSVELGRGKIDFRALVQMMRKVNYTGMCSLEYEKDRNDPFMGIAESIGYFKAVSKIV